MVRDLVELAVEMVRSEKGAEVTDKARAAAEERLLDLLLPRRAPLPGEDAPAGEQEGRSRERLREQLRAGRLDERTVELDVQEPAMPDDGDHRRRLRRGPRREPSRTSWATCSRGGRRRGA